MRLKKSKKLLTSEMVECCIVVTLKTIYITYKVDSEFFFNKKACVIRTQRTKNKIEGS